MPFLPFVYGYPSYSPRAHCTANKSVPTLRYTRRHGATYIYIYIYMVHASRHLPSVVPWVSEDSLLPNSLLTCAAVSKTSKTTVSPSTHRVQVYTFSESRKLSNINLANSTLCSTPCQGDHRKKREGQRQEHFISTNTRSDWLSDWPREGERQEHFISTNTRSDWPREGERQEHLV